MRKHEREFSSSLNYSQIQSLLFILTWYQSGSILLYASQSSLVQNLTPFVVYHCCPPFSIVGCMRFLWQPRDLECLSERWPNPSVPKVDSLPCDAHVPNLCPPLLVHVHPRATFLSQELHRATITCLAITPCLCFGYWNFIVMQPKVILVEGYHRVLEKTTNVSNAEMVKPKFSYNTQNFLD